MTKHYTKKSNKNNTDKIGHSDQVCCEQTRVFLTFFLDLGHRPLFRWKIACHRQQRQNNKNMGHTKRQTHRNSERPQRRRFGTPKFFTCSQFLRGLHFDRALMISILPHTTEQSRFGTATQMPTLILYMDTKKKSQEFTACAARGASRAPAITLFACGKFPRKLN